MFALYTTIFRTGALPVIISNKRNSDTFVYYTYIMALPMILKIQRLSIKTETIDATETGNTEKW